jgi:hypothetical protein
MRVIVPNLPDQYHLAFIMEEMRKYGTPQIRAIWSNGMWYAAEGSHRIVAAKRLGLMPVIIDITGEGATVQRNGVETSMSAGELQEWLTSDLQAPIYDFNEQADVTGDLDTDSCRFYREYMGQPYNDEDEEK